MLCRSVKTRHESAGSAHDHVLAIRGILRKHLLFLHDPYDLQCPLRHHDDDIVNAEVACLAVLHTTSLTSAALHSATWTAC